jgi:hypothetical protein
MADKINLTWVLQANHKNLEENVARMRNSLIRSKTAFVDVNISPYDHSVEGGDPVLTGNIVAYGSTGIDTVVARNHWLPGVWASSDMSESGSLKILGNDYLNHDMKIVSCHDVANVAADLDLEFVFMKPNSNTKRFGGCVVETSRLYFFMEPIIANLQGKDLDVCIAPIRQIKEEYRLFIVSGQVVSASMYTKNFQKTIVAGATPEVIAYAEEILKKYNPVDAFVLDICVTDDNMYVVEANPFNHSGLYANDTDAIVSAINTLVSGDEQGF